MAILIYDKIVNFNNVLDMEIIEGNINITFIGGITKLIEIQDRRVAERVLDRIKNQINK